jgi:3-hydroxybutyrate dehydrogenase
MPSPPPAHSHGRIDDAQSKLALVTGSTSGIGLGIARALAAQGADIVLNGFGEADDRGAVGASSGRLGVQVASRAADLTRQPTSGTLMERCAAHGGRRRLVNNAASSTCRR